MAAVRLVLPDVLQQHERWVNGERLEDMDPHHRANLIPFLRRNARVLQRAAEARYYDSALGSLDICEVSDGVAGAMRAAEAQFHLPAEDWLADTPLMRRLVELEKGRPLAARKATAVRNAAYEALTGYRKVVLK